MAGFFPIFFKQYWSGATDTTVSTFELGMGNSIASIMVVLIAPLLGAIADKGQLRKQFLLVFAILGIVCTALMYWIDKGEWLAAIICYCVALIGFMGANVFYDALVVSVATPQQRDLVSALGYALGYLGGGVLFALNVAMTVSPEFFGIDDATHAVKLSFLSVAIWWSLFSIPLLLYVKDAQQTPKQRGKILISSGFIQLVTTIRKIKLYRNIVIFLFAYWFYIDGVDTVVRMAVDYGLALGLSQNDLIIALLIAQFVGFPATIGFGYLSQYLGNKVGLYIGLLCYVGVTFWAYFINESWEFYLLAVAVGLVQGGVQALSRSFYATLIPRDQQGEFFGFYNMMGKSAAILGPLLVGGVSVLTHNHRYGMLSVLILFVIGGLLFTYVKEQRIKDYSA